MKSLTLAQHATSCYCYVSSTYTHTMTNAATVTYTITVLTLTGLCLDQNLKGAFKVCP